MMSTDWIMQQIINGHGASVMLASFAGGVISSLLPCSLAMLPILIGYLGGYSKETSKGAVILQACLFILGVACVLTVLGIITSLLGLAFGSLIGSGWYYLIGALAILMGLQLLNVFHLPIPQLIKKLPDTQTGKLLTPLTLGLAFGLASSPCGTPFLSVILGLLSQEHNWLLGGSSLFCYALGQGALLFLVGLGTGLLKHMALLRKISFVMNYISGAAFILVGLYLLLLGSGKLGDLLILLSPQ
jgi:cytochrome c-type biogenesis protein